jgi:hypothetical protein
MLHTTADLPLSVRVDPVTFAVARAARAAGLTLAREGCSCSIPRADCPTCLTAAVEALRR